MGETASDDGHTVTVQGYQPITYENIETCIITNTSSVDNNNIGSPDQYQLFQNYPNPFNPETTIRFSLPKSDPVSLRIYDLLGKEVETLIREYRNAGDYEIEWSALDFPSGIYLYRLEAGDFVETKKLILQK